MAERDPYRVLGVAPGASHREIRDAYRRRARMAHPDLAGEDSASWMRDLNAAWEVLKDPERRAAHDAASGLTPPRANGDGTGTATGTGSSTERFARASDEPWRGAAGPPPGTPYGTVLDTGIYAGWSLAQVARRDRGYLAWLRERPEGRRHAAEIERILGTTSGKEHQGRGRRGRS
jgi:curved DNA-binding protein CbpA